MINKIRGYLDYEFRNVPESRKATELKDELFANLVEKYNDQLVNGKSEAEAYNSVIAGIGDITEMIDSLKMSGYTQAVADPGLRKRRATLVASAVCCFILSPMPIIFFSVMGHWLLGLMLLFILVAAGVGLIIFTNISMPNYKKSDETMVEDFKEWRSKNQYKQSSYKAFASAYWMLVVTTYIIISFLTSAWHITWIIFIIATAIKNIVKGMLELRGDQNE